MCEALPSTGLLVSFTPFDFLLLIAVLQVVCFADSCKERTKLVRKNARIKKDMECLFFVHNQLTSLLGKPHMAIPDFERAVADGVFPWQEQDQHVAVGYARLVMRSLRSSFYLVVFMLCLLTGMLYLSNESVLFEDMKNVAERVACIYRLCEEKVIVRQEMTRFISHYERLIQRVEDNIASIRKGQLPPSARTDIRASFYQVVNMSPRICQGLLCLACDGRQFVFGQLQLAARLFDQHSPAAAEHSQPESDGGESSTGELTFSDSDSCTELSDDSSSSDEDSD